MESSQVNTGIPGILSLFVAAVCAMCAVYSCFITFRYLQGAEKSQGIVEEIKENRVGVGQQAKTVYAPVIRFTTQAEQTVVFASQKTSLVPEFVVGDKVPVLYVKKNPQDAIIYSLVAVWLWPGVFSLGTLLMLTLGWVLKMIKIEHESDRWLQTEGRRVQSLFQKIDTVPGQKNGRPAYRIVSSWQNPADNRIYLFESRLIWFNPEPFVKTGLIPVWVNPINPNKYLVDTSFLPKDPPPIVEVKKLAS